MQLFNAWYTKSSTIEEFEIAQNQLTDQAGNGLRDNWVTALQVAFKSSFKDVGKHMSFTKHADPSAQAHGAERASSPGNVGVAYPCMKTDFD